MTVLERHKLGRETEALAAIWFLTHKNATLLAKNYRAKCGEIDLIFEEILPGGLHELVFVEVRAHSDRNWMNGPQSVDSWKQQRLKTTATHYLTRYLGSAQSLRLDLLSWDGELWTYLPNLWI
jgi:putative endonuclease